MISSWQYRSERYLLKIISLQLDENPAQSTSELAIKLNIDRTIIIKRLHDIWEKFIKKENGFHISYRKIPLRTN